MDIAIYGTGGLGKEMAFLAEENSDGYEQIVFIDDIRKEKVFLGYPVCSFEKFCESVSPGDCQVIIALGEPELRTMLAWKVIAAGYQLGKIIAGSAKISKYAVIGDGTAIFHNCIVMPDVMIGQNCLLQSSVTLTHDDHVGNNCVLSHRVTAGGSTVIGDNCFVGIGGILRDHIAIGEFSIVGMGSVVTKSFQDHSVLVGNPAKIIKKNDNFKVFR